MIQIGKKGGFLSEGLTLTFQDISEFQLVLIERRKEKNKGVWKRDGGVSFSLITLFFYELMSFSVTMDGWRFVRLFPLKTMRLQGRFCVWKRLFKLSYPLIRDI
jgi:hypothetical protein